MLADRKSRKMRSAQLRGILRSRGLTAIMRAERLRLLAYDFLTQQCEQPTDGAWAPQQAWFLEFCTPKSVRFLPRSPDAEVSASQLSART
jgi:hypothetical protein